MKNRIIYLLCIVATLLQGCVQDVDDLFDASASERMTRTLEDYRTQLSGAENGWLMEYFPSDIQAYGGFAIAMKFDAKDHTTVWGGMAAEPTAQSSSLYSLKSDLGPTLNFDTYNNILHYFSDPDNTDGGGQGKAYEGDYEFIFQSHTQDSIVLKGKKTKNIIRMIRLEEAPEAYLAKSMGISRAFDAFKGILGFGGVVDGKPLKATFVNARRFTVSYGDETVNAPFIFTPTGIQFYQPLKVGSKVLYRLTWSAANETLTAEADPAVVLDIIRDPEYPAYAQYIGTYTMNYKVGNTAKSVTIQLEQKVYKQSYFLKGLPFALIMDYNSNKKCMELKVQNLQDGSGAYVAAWEVTGAGNLWNRKDLGLISVLREGTNNVYDFVDNGAWGDTIAKGIILWSKAGEYTKYGDSRFTYISFIKN